MLGNFYEKELELKNERLSKEVINLSKINSDLIVYKNKIAKKTKGNKSKHEKDIKYKTRLLTYLKDKLITLDVNDISFINTDHSVTYITCINEKKYPINSSLDELMSSLDPKIFFRANRQNIISVNGIDEILKYGNSQLKIITNPISETLILISKNRVSDFKKWLNN